MPKSEWTKSLLTRENLYKLGLMIFGLTLFPGMVHLFGKVILPTTKTLSDYYIYFYRSLLDMGKDGLIVWAIACGPYMAYEVYLLLASLGAKKGETTKK